MDRPSEDVETQPEPAAAALTAVRLIRDDDHPHLEAIRAYAAEHGIELSEVDARAFAGDAAAVPSPEADAAGGHWIVAAADDVVAVAVDRAGDSNAALGVVPAPGSRLDRLFALPKGVDAQIELAFAPESVTLDVTRCNGEVVLGLAAIGDVPFLDQRGRAFLRAQPNSLRRAGAALAVLWAAVRRLFAIRPYSVRLQIGDEDKPRRSAVTGIVVLENDADKLTGQMLGERLSARDGRLSAMLLAPASVAAYLAVLTRAAFGGRTLPRALSFVKTRRLRVECDAPLPYRIDGRARSADEIVFDVSPAAVAFKVGPGFADDNRESGEDKDTLRLKTLPEHETRLASISTRLPLFTHALEDDFRDLFQLLREGARVGPDYVFLMLASALLAGLGLMLNSPAVVIGAMVLAPLMSPIVSLAMAILRRDETLLRGAVRTIAVGVVLALLVASVLALLSPLKRLTPEIEARLHPSLLDLAVAVVSGIAAAYAHARENIMKSLAGVAIAVALVPPLAAAGIGVGWLDTRIFGGAILLFLTNLVGIAAAAALTFLVLGYAPIRTAARGLRQLALALVLMALPLYFSFAHIVETWRLESLIEAEPLSSGSAAFTLLEPSVRIDGDTVVVRATVAGDTPLTPADAEAIKRRLEQRLRREVRVELDWRLVR